MKLGIYTNTDEQCGNAQYAFDLRTQLLKYFGDITMSPDRNSFGHVDVVIANWHPAKVEVTADLIRAWKSAGKKVVLIWANTIGWRQEVDDNDVLAVADAVVVHEPVDVVGNVNLKLIPHGILEVDGLHNGERHAIGTAGFLFPWKRPDVVVEAARRLGVTARMICPPYGSVIDQNALEREWSAKCQLEMDKGWHPAADVIRSLSENVLNIFWFQSQTIEDQLGQTGSARLGVAARRPMIISGHRKFQTLWKFADELYIADKEEEVYEYAAEILAHPDLARKPNRVITLTGWTQAGVKYKQVIEGL